MGVTSKKKYIDKVERVPVVYQVHIQCVLSINIPIARYDAEKRCSLSSYAVALFLLYRLFCSFWLLWL